MKVAIISGSHRSNSASDKVSNYLQRRINEIDHSAEADIIQLSKTKLPLWDESFYSPTSELAQQWQPIANRLTMATAYIVISPEWGGMVTPGLKNLLLMATGGEMSHKPALIVTVSGGQGGSYPVNELRTSGYKNSQICYLPEHIIIRHAEQMLNKPSIPENSMDQYIRDRIDYGLKLLSAYNDGLTLVREKGVIDHKNYPYGM